MCVYIIYIYSYVKKGRTPFRILWFYVTGYNKKIKKSGL